VDNGVGDGLADGGTDIAELLKGRVELGGEAGDGAACEALVGAARGEFQLYVILLFHVLTSRTA